MSERSEFQRIMAEQAERNRQTNELQLNFGEHQALAHLAVFSTACAVSGVVLEAKKRKDEIRVRTIASAYKIAPFLKIPKPGTLNYGIAGKSGQTQPFISANIKTTVRGRSSSAHSFIPESVNRALLNSDWIIGSSELALESRPAIIGSPLLRVGIYAEHTSWDITKSTLKTTKNADDNAAFEPLFELIEDITEAPEDDTYTRSGVATKKDIVTITDNPERHFDFHAALGIQHTQMEIARTNFNVIAQVADIPYRTNI
ncbi:hypothetical protein EBZ38_08845 [bacterium]|nr:hypothetical protein [bacterium]